MLNEMERRSFVRRNYGRGEVLNENDTTRALIKQMNRSQMTWKVESQLQKIVYGFRWLRKGLDSSENAIWNSNANGARSVFFVRQIANLNISRRTFMEISGMLSNSSRCRKQVSNFSHESSVTISYLSSKKSTKFITRHSSLIPEVETKRQPKRKRILFWKFFSFFSKFKSEKANADCWFFLCWSTRFFSVVVTLSYILYFHSWNEPHKHSLTIKRFNNFSCILFLRELLILIHKKIITHVYMNFLVFRVFSSLAVVRTQKILRNLHFDRNQLLLINQIQKSSSLSFTNPIIVRTHQLHF